MGLCITKRGKPWRNDPDGGRRKEEYDELLEITRHTKVSVMVFNDDLDELGDRCHVWLDRNAITKEETNQLRKMLREIEVKKRENGTRQTRANVVRWNCVAGSVACACIPCFCPCLCLCVPCAHSCRYRSKRYLSVRGRIKEPYVVG